MDTNEALTLLGVSDDLLSSHQKQQLVDDGYLTFPDVLNEKQLEVFRNRLDQLYKEEGATAGLELTQEVGCPRLTNLINKDPIFDICFTYPPMLAAVSHVLKCEFKTNSLNYRDTLVNYGLQRLHPDLEWVVKPGHYIKCNALWLIDAHTGENGSTRLVPGSHLSGQHPRETMDNHYDRHPDEVILIEPAGTVVVCNAHIWHGGTCNTSGDRRRTLHASFIKRDLDQQLTERKFIQPKTSERLSPELRFLLDVD